MAAQLPAVLKALDQPDYRQWAELALERGVPRGKRMIDDSEVGDHHAIIPTAKSLDIGRLGPDEKRIYDLVARRFIAGFLADAVFDKTVIETRVNTDGPSHRFVTRGKVCVDPGWQEIEPRPKAGKKTGQKDRRDRDRPLPDLRRGDAVHTDSADVNEGKTEPPPALLRGQLAGFDGKSGARPRRRSPAPGPQRGRLGHPGDPRRHHRNPAQTPLHRTQRQSAPPPPPAVAPSSPPCRWTIFCLPSSPARGRRSWPRSPEEAWRGRRSCAMFANSRPRIVTAIAAVESSELGEVAGRVEVLGSCPICHTDVTEGFKTYNCATGKKCSFVIFKRIAGRAISPALVRVLLGRGQSQVLRGFRSKTRQAVSSRPRSRRGRYGEHGLRQQPPRSGLWRERNGQGQGPYPRRLQGARRRPIGDPIEDQDPPWLSGGRGAPAPPAKAGGKTPVESAPARGPRCPACRKGRIIAGRRGWGCSRWRESCGFVVWFEFGDFRLPDDEAERLFRRGQTRLMDGLSPSG